MAAITELDSDMELRQIDSAVTCDAASFGVAAHVAGISQPA